MNEQDYMRLAIRKAQEGIAAGQSPFGSAIIRLGEVVAVTHNTVWRDTDPRRTSRKSARISDGNYDGNDGSRQRPDAAANSHVTSYIWAELGICHT